MSTRKLILTALVCGLAIIVAGGIKLFQVASDTKQVEVLSLGTTAKLADMTVSVTAIRQTDEATIATVTMVGVDGADATEGWRLLASGAVRAPIALDDAPDDALDDKVDFCTVTQDDIVVTCQVGFEASDGSVTVAYIRGGAQAQWSR
jgi:hypothetical protein